MQNQSFQAELLVSGLHAGEQFGVKLLPVGNADRGGEAAFVRRTENRAALVQDARSAFVTQRHVSDRIDQPFVALEKPDHIVADARRTFDGPRESPR